MSLIQFHSSKLICVCILLFTAISSVSSVRTLQATQNLGIKAVNLGGWLVTEGWITPSLFASIPNKDLLDGYALQFRSVTVGKYLCAELGGGSIIVANRSSASGWETFRLWRVNATSFQLRVFDQKFVGLRGVEVVATAEGAAAAAETFQIERSSGDPNRVRLKARNGLYLQVKTEVVVTADGKGDGGWGDNDPTVFIMTTARRLQGEFQVTNGYGPIKAPQVMQEHWSTYIVEADFKFISQNGLNAVRIPVGWWIASDPNPPKPYVGGSLKALDNAFTWAQYVFFIHQPLLLTYPFLIPQLLCRKYGLKVIIDLHAAEGSQNGNDHSSTRDGSQEWGLTDTNIQATVAVIDFLTARYAKSPSLYAVELLNEPVAPGVTLDNLTKFYKAGYAAVRKHSSSAYVIMSNRLSSPDARELFPLANNSPGSVIDVHYYNLFSSIFDNTTPQQNIDFVKGQRTDELNYVTTADGPLTFVGEWVAEWQVAGATKEDYQRFAKAQLELFGRATFGWAYWTLKNVNNHWSMEWMIKNGYITL